MKKFEFSLQKMQRYKQQILDKEKALLAALQNKRDRIQNQIEELEAFLVEQSHELQARQAKGMSAAELAGHNFIVQNTRTRLEDLRLELLNAEKEVEEQRKIVMQASQEVKSIDKLEEKQLEEYQLEASRAENEERMELLTMTK